MKNTHTLTDVSKHLFNQDIGLFSCDTIFGLIGLANPKVARKLSQVKQRSTQKGFIHLIGNLKHLEHLIELPLSNKQKLLIESYWPGPLSLIFKKSKSVDCLQSGSQTTLAIRFPNYKPLNELLDLIDQPLLSTSANITQQQHVDCIEQLDERLKAQCKFCYIQPKCQPGLASTIVDTTQKPMLILRQGSLYLDSSLL